MSKIPAENTQAIDTTCITPNHKKHHLALPTPVNVNALSTHLEGYSNAEFFLNGFEHGFMINFDGPEIPLQSGSWSL